MSNLSSKEVFAQLNQNVDIETLAQQMGQKKRRKSSRNWPKYAIGDKSVVIKKSTNSFFTTDESCSGDVVSFVKYFILNNTDDWGEVEQKAREILSLPDRYVPPKFDTSSNNSNSPRGGQTKNRLVYNQ